MITKKAKLRVCVVGNLLGRNPGYITTQGQILADLLEASGYAVTSVSSKLNRVFRLGEIAVTILLNRKIFDLMIVEVYSGPSFVIADAASFLAKLFGIPSILVLHGGNLPEFMGRFPRWTKRVLRRADTIAAPSKFLAKQIGDLGFDIRVVPNVIDIVAYPFRLRQVVQPKLIWMRSFHDIYNPLLAVRAFHLVYKKRPESTLVMAGVDKGLKEKVKQYAKDLGMADSVRFPGFLDSESKIREFSSADIYLNTNRIDNMPVSVIEACAMGLPVVATNVGGLPYLIEHGENGLLVNNNDAEALSEAVTMLLDRNYLAERLSRNGRLLAERSSWDSVRVLWNHLIAEVVSKKDIAKRGRFAAAARRENA